MTNIAKIKIEKMVYGGDGMGHLPDGRAIFVPFALSDELVTVEITDEKKRFARGTLVEIVESASNRIEPRCQHFGVCGGCQYQMLDYPDQFNTKVEILHDQFLRIANIDLGDEVIQFPSVNPWNYRQTIQLHIAKGKVGYLESNSHHVMPVEECFLPKGDFDQVLKMLDFAEDAQIQTAKIRWGDDDVLIVLEGETPEAPELEVDFPASILFQYGDDLIVLAGDDHQEITVLDVPFLVSANSFFQASAEMAGEMVKFLLTELKPTAADFMLDLYCGVGLFSRFMGDAGAGCVGIESSSSAVADFAANLDHLEDVQIFEGLVEDILPSLEIHPDICLMDPPRGGVDPEVIDELVDLQIPRLAYVSCDVATLARDIKRLTAGGYRLEKTALFDQFPHTSHMETICLLVWVGD